MTSGPTVLTAAAPAAVRAEPFPHLVLADAIDADLCRELTRCFPPLDVISGRREHRSNERFSLPAAEALGNAAVPRSWKRLIESHLSQAFLDQLLGVFGDGIRKTHPDFERSCGGLGALRAGVFGVDDFETADVLLGAQLCASSPVIGEPTSVRGPHVDLPDKLFAGLFYIRDPEDDSQGGDLELYRFRDEPGGFRGQFIGEHYVERVDRVPYRTNLLVLFINSIQSLHGVAARSPTRHPRRFLNLIGYVCAPLFDLDAYQQRVAPEGTGWQPIPSRNGRRRRRTRRLLRVWQRLRALGV